MSNGAKPSFMDKLAALFKEEGIDTQASGGAATTTEALDAQIVKANATIAKTLVDATCAHCGADAKASVLPLAVLAVVADGGEIGANCKAFQVLALAGQGIKPTDMQTPMIVQIANQNDGAANDLKKQAAKVLGTAVGMINAAGGQ